MKRLVPLLVAFLLLIPVSASADVVYGNEFASDHREELIDLERSQYVVNGPEGYVYGQEEPGQNEQYSTEYPGTHLKKFENGEIVSISDYLFYKGEYWAVMPASHSGGYPYWIRLDHLLVSYTADDWEKEHEDEFYEAPEKMPALSESEGLVLWSWPGSDQEKYILEGSYYEISVRSIYKDSQGREWAKVGADHGASWYVIGWVYLDSPYDSSVIPAFNPAPTPQVWSPDATYEWSVVDGEYPAPPSGPVKPPTSSASSGMATQLAMLFVAGCALGTVPVAHFFTTKRGKKWKKKQ